MSSITDSEDIHIPDCSEHLFLLQLERFRVEKSEFGTGVVAHDDALAFSSDGESLTHEIDSTSSSEGKDYKFISLTEGPPDANLTKERKELACQRSLLEILKSSKPKLSSEKKQFKMTDFIKFRQP